MRTLVIFAAAAAVLLAESSAGLKWTAPSGWASKGPAPMRAATYAVGDAECVIYFFGPGQGGSVDANISRWSGQFSGGASARVTKLNVHGLPVTRMDVSGTYVATGGAAMTQQAAKAGSRMLAAIVEGPGGSIFVKFTGPAGSMANRVAEFDKLIASFQKE